VSTQRTPVRGGRRETIPGDRPAAGADASLLRSVAGRVGSRVLGAAGVLWGAATLTFLALVLIPGDIAYAIVGGPDSNPSPEVLAEVRREYGLDRPVWEQYGAYLLRLLTGDLGTSYRFHAPVGQLIGEQVGPTVVLALSAGVVGVLGAVVVALATAGRRPAVRGPVSGVELVLASLPSFWLGIVLLTVFSFTLGWFPSIGGEGWRGLVLPTLTLALPMGAVLSQVVRASVEEVLEEPFVVTARARGLTDTAVRVRHVLRHTLVPLTTMSGFVVGGLFGGAVITETLFNRQGLGRLLLSAVDSKDMPVVLGLVLLSAAVYVVVNLVVDATYPLIDPRLRSAS
jgi:peptide/nickel transport system permease protein